MAALTYARIAPALTPLQMAMDEMHAFVTKIAGTFLTGPQSDALDRFAVAFAAELLDSNVVNDTSKSPEFDRLLAAAYQASAQHLEADKGRFESEGEIDGYETAVTMLEEYRDGAVRRGNRMVRS